MTWDSFFDSKSGNPGYSILKILFLYYLRQFFYLKYSFILKMDKQVRAFKNLEEVKKTWKIISKKFEQPCK